MANASINQIKIKNTATESPVLYDISIGVEKTQAEYDALSQEEKNNGVYWITDSDVTPTAINASNVSYNNAQSGLEASNVQGAIDKLNDNLTGSLNGFEFGYTEDGKPGYREAGADTFLPFNKDSYCIRCPNSTLTWYSSNNMEIHT